MPRDTELTSLGGRASTSIGVSVTIQNGAIKRNRNSRGAVFVFPSNANLKIPDADEDLNGFGFTKQGLKRFWHSLPKASKALVILSILEALLVAVYAVFYAVDGAKVMGLTQRLGKKDEEAHVALALGVTCIFFCAFVLDALWKENGYELLAALLLAVPVGARIIYFQFRTKHTDDDFVWMGFSAIVSVLWVATAILAGISFMNLGWRQYGRLWADYRQDDFAALKTRLFKATAAFNTLRKLDAQFLLVMTLIALVMAFEKRLDHPWWLIFGCNMAGFVVGLALAVWAWKLVKRPRRLAKHIFWLDLAMLLSFAQPVASVVILATHRSGDKANAAVSLFVSSGLFAAFRWAELLCLHVVAELHRRLEELHQRVAESSGGRLALEGAVGQGHLPALLPLMRGAWLGKPSPSNPNKTRYFQLSQDKMKLQWSWRKKVWLINTESIIGDCQGWTITLSFVMDADIRLQCYSRESFEEWILGLEISLAFLLAPVVHATDLANAVERRRLLQLLGFSVTDSGPRLCIERVVQPQPGEEETGVQEVASENSDQRGRREALSHWLLKMLRGRSTTSQLPTPSDLPAQLFPLQPGPLSPQTPAPPAGLTPASSQWSSSAAGPQPPQDPPLDTNAVLFPSGLRTAGSSSTFSVDGNRLAAPSSWTMTSAGPSRQSSLSSALSGDGTASLGRRLSARLGAHQRAAAGAAGLEGRLLGENSVDSLAESLSMARPGSVFLQPPPQQHGGAVSQEELQRTMTEMYAKILKTEAAEKAKREEEARQEEAARREEEARQEEAARREDEAKRDAAQQQAFHAQAAGPDNAGVCVQPSGPSLPSLAQLTNDIDVIRYEELELGSQSIGRGAGGVVYPAWWGTGPSRRAVAVKRIAEVTDETLREIRIHHAAQGNANIVSLHAWCQHEDALYLVMELCQQGNLHQMLKEQQSKPHVRWEVRKLLKIVRGIIAGVVHLHSQDPPILHRDLKPLNIFVVGSDAVKIGDFGHSRFLDYKLISHPPGAAPRPLVRKLTPDRIGTVNYTAPEVFPTDPQPLESHEPFLAIDIYQLGATLWEILTFGECPFAEERPERVAVALMEANADFLRLPRPSFRSTKDVASRGILEKLADMVDDMRNLKPDKRPTAAELLKEIWKLDAQAQGPFIA